MDEILQSQSEGLIDSIFAMYIATIWAVGFLSGVFRTAYNGNYRNVFHCFSTGVLAGLISVTVVGIWTSFVPVTPGNSMFFVSVSMVIGLSGRESIDFLKITTDGIKEMFQNLTGWGKNGK